jgi:DNA-binding transcriptional ArsR family regulator
MVSSDLQELLHYVEEWGFFFDRWGLPRTAGRVWGWLSVCEPPEQSAQDLVQVLQVSKASISTNIRLLEGLGLVERASKPGARQGYYRLRADAFESIMRQRIGGVTQARVLAQRGIDLLGSGDPGRAKRLEATRDFYAFLEREMEVLLEHWRERRGREELVD